MNDPTDNENRMERIARTMEAGHWRSSAKIVREAADEIERLRAERDEANRHADQYAQRNAVLVVEIDKVRQELKEAKARNTLYLSRLQEHEAREQ